jgi:hypothetical protein
MNTRLEARPPRTSSAEFTSNARYGRLLRNREGNQRIHQLGFLSRGVAWPPQTHQRTRLGYQQPPFIYEKTGARVARPDLVTKNDTQNGPRMGTRPPERTHGPRVIQRAQRTHPCTSQSSENNPMLMLHTIFAWPSSGIRKRFPFISIMY